MEENFNMEWNMEWKTFSMEWKWNGRKLAQARRQDCVTGGAEINFGRAREVYFV